MTEEKKEKEEKEIKFDLNQVEKTFTTYKLNQILDGVVVQKREDGLIFNIGGKKDAFIAKEDFEDYSLIKFGDRFKVVITNIQNDEGLIEVSKSKADNLILESMQAKELKLGKSFAFVITGVSGQNLTSKLGEYNITIPADEVSARPVKNIKYFVGKRLEGIVTDIDAENKKITASCKMLEERKIQNISNSFWSSIFVNKLVNGTIKKIMPYGAFVDVNGITCLCHISDIAHERVEDVSKYLQVGKEYTFKVVKVDKENEKVGISYKALQKSSKQKLLEEVEIGKEHKAKVIKMLPFGAIVKVEKENLEGLLHISDASLVYGTEIKDIVKMGEELEVIIKKVYSEKGKINFELKVKR